MLQTSDPHPEAVPVQTQGSVEEARPPVDAAPDKAASSANPPPPKSPPMKTGVLVSNDPLKVILPRSLLEGASSSSNQTRYQQRFARVMQGELMLGHNELNSANFASRYIQYNARSDGTLDPQIEYEAVLLGALLQWTEDEAKDHARISAALSGTDLPKIAKDHPGFHCLERYGASLERLQRLVIQNPLPSPPPAATKPYTPMTLPMQFVGDDGSVVQIQVPLSELHNMTVDDIQNPANPVFPIPAEREVKDAISTTIAETTQKYLDAITDVGIVSAITPDIKYKTDKIIFDIGVFMFFRDEVIPETEVTWHSLDQVLLKAPPTSEMIAMIVNLTGSRQLNGVFGSVVGRAQRKRGQPIRWSFMLDNPQLFEGRYANGVDVRTENLRMMTNDKLGSEK